MSASDTDPEIPDTGAVFSFGKSNFADNIPSKFWIRKDPIRQLACGFDHTAVVTETGRVFVFGNNDVGQLGHGFPKSAVKPTCIKALKHERVLKIACGKNHSIVLTEKGNLYGFGSNEEGQLGFIDIKDVKEPMVMEGFDSPVAQIACGESESAVLSEDGRIFLLGKRWRNNSEKNYFVLKLSRAVICVSLGAFHIIFATDDDKLYIIDSNEISNLDLDVNLEEQIDPVSGIDGKIIKISCGGKHSALLTANGKLYTIGDGKYGQLGLGTRILESSTLKLVTGLEHLKLTEVECGENHVAVMSENGTLFVFGDGSNGKLGLDNENFSNQFWPAKVLNFKLYSVEKVSCGGHHTMVLAKLRLPEEVELFGDEDIEPFRSSSVESNDVVISTARSRRHKRDLPPLKFPGKQLESIASVEADSNNVEKLPNILPVEEYQNKMAESNKKEIKYETENLKNEMQNEINTIDDDSDISEIDVKEEAELEGAASGNDIGGEKKAGNKKEDSDEVPQEVIAFVNNQINVLPDSNLSSNGSSLEESDNEIEESIVSPERTAETSKKEEQINSRKSSIKNSNKQISNERRKSSIVVVRGRMNEDTESDEESNESEIEESEITNEISKDISEKDLKEASNSRDNGESANNINGRKKKNGINVFNRMFGNKSKPTERKSPSKKDSEPTESNSTDPGNPTTENKTSPEKAVSPSKEPVPAISQSSLFCLPPKKVRFTQEESETTPVEPHHSVTCLLM